MSWQTSGGVLALRRLGRELGLNRVLGSLIGGTEYELKFQRAMLEAIRPGDVVWDVGANVGLYSALFSDIAGSAGRVFAYEPSPHNLLRLKDAVALLGNVMVVPVALGERNETVYLEQGDDSLGATSRVMQHEGTTPGRVSVRQESGDDLVSSGAVPPPAVMKIDTEGCELDVLRGLRQTLQNPKLRAVCVEVHFRLLDERGLAHAPSEIERMLASAGFDVAWPDASHIVATRS